MHHVISQADMDQKKAHGKYQQVPTTRNHREEEPIRDFQKRFRLA
jgi:hypothetical protein